MDALGVVKKLHWLGHDTFRLDGPVVIYFDPWQLQGEQVKADLVLISHEHHDHCSPEDVARVRTPQTVVLAGGSAAEKVAGARAVKPGDKLTVKGIEIEAVPAYNVNKFRSPGVPFHPQPSQHVGYVVTVDGVRIYFAGDTDQIPEMSEIECDVGLLPVSGKYTMTAEEAAKAARVLDPVVVVPMHYGSGIGQGDAGQHFAELYGGEVAILERE